MKQNNKKRDYPYHSYRFSLHNEVHASSIRVLESIRPCHRGEFISAAIESYLRRQKLTVDSHETSANEKNSPLTAAAGDKKLTVDQKTMPKSNISKEGEFFW